MMTFWQFQSFFFPQSQKRTQRTGRQQNKILAPTARFTWFLMNRRRTNQLLGFDRDVVLNTMAMLTGHFVMGRYAERMRLPFNDFCHGCKSSKEEETVNNFFCQCKSLARCRNRWFEYIFVYQTFCLVFQRGVVVLLKGSPYAVQLLP